MSMLQRALKLVQVFVFGLVFIVSISVEITPSDSQTAGETFSLECSCSVNGTSDTPSYQWLVGPPNNRTLLISGGSLNINSYTTSSLLQFTTLRASDGGEYTCQVTVGGHVTERTTMIVEISRKYHILPHVSTLMYMAMGLTPFSQFHPLLMQSLHQQL